MAQKIDYSGLPDKVQPKELEITLKGRPSTIDYSGLPDKAIPEVQAPVQATTPVIQPQVIERPSLIPWDKKIDINTGEFLPDNTIRPLEESEQPWWDKAYHGIMDTPSFIMDPARRFAEEMTKPSPGLLKMEQMGVRIPVFPGISITPSQAKGAIGGTVEGIASLLSLANILTLGRGKLPQMAARVLGGAQLAHGAHEITEGNLAEAAGDIGFGLLDVASTLPLKGLTNQIPDEQIVQEFLKKVEAEEIAKLQQKVIDTAQPKVDVIPQAEVPKVETPQAPPEFPLAELPMSARPEGMHPKDVEGLQRLGEIFGRERADLTAGNIGDEVKNLILELEARYPPNPNTVRFLDKPEKGHTPGETPTIADETLRELGIASVEEPTFARTEGGIKIGADVKSLGKVLGSSLYQGNIAKIATKELLQNSLDAIRPLGKSGVAKVVLNPEQGFIEVADNGPGLTRQEIETVFTDLGASGKRGDESAIGGFGLAKAAPLLGGEKVTVQTIVREADGKKYVHQFTGTPEELLSGVKVETSPAADGTPTGTTVRTQVPKDSEFWDAKRFVGSLLKFSDIEGKVVFEDHNIYGGPPTISQFEGKSIKDDADVTTISAKNADVEIIIPKGTKYGPSAGVEYQILNNGMWQGRGHGGGFNEVPGIPEKVLINIKSKVPEGDTNYPFTANREKIRGDVEQQIDKYLREVIISPAVGKRFNELRQVWEGMPEVNLPRAKGPKKFFVYDVGKKFRPDELDLILNNKAVLRMSEEISNVLHDTLKYVGTDYQEKLQRIGLIFDEKVYGIHIPKPGENQSAILINPFEHFIKHEPDGASAGLLHTIMHEISHIPGGGHDEDFTYRLGKLYQDYGAERAIKAQRAILDSITSSRNKLDYNEEIQGILQRYKESRGRGGIEEDPLRGTGISRETQSKGKGKIPQYPNDYSNRAITKLYDAIEEAKGLRQEQEGMYSAERAARIGAAKGVKLSGWKSVKQKFGKLAGEYEKVDYAPELKLGSKDVEGLLAAINTAPLREFEKMRAFRALGKLFGEFEGLPQHNELALLDKVFGEGFSGQIVELYGGLGVVPSGPLKGVLNETANFTKSMMASTDLSAPLRQGAPLMYRKEYWKALPEMLKYGASQEAFENLINTLHTRPLYDIGKKSGLALTDIGSNLHQREEQYLSKLAEMLPNVRMSERAYVGFLNKLRADVFDSMITDALKAGHDPRGKIGKDIAKFVNAATGRGSLGSLERFALELNYGLFSPRLLASRLTMLNPMYYVNLHPQVRKEALKALFSVAALGTTVASIGAMAGGSVSDNPTSADFGKVRIGKVRIDPWAGFQQYVVAAMKLIRNQSTSTISGETTKLGSSFTAPTKLSIVGDLLRSKESPVASFVHDYLSGKDFAGRPFTMGANLNNALYRRVAPIIVQDIISLAQEEPELLPLVALPFVGMGMQVYDERERQQPGQLREMRDISNEVRELRRSR